MHPLLAALIPTLLLGFSILFLVIRLQNKSKRIEELEAKLKEPAPKIIRGEGTTQPPFPTEKPAEPALNPQQARKPSRPAQCRRRLISTPPTPFWRRFRKN